MNPPRRNPRRTFRCGGEEGSVGDHPCVCAIGPLDRIDTGADSRLDLGVGVVAGVLIGAENGRAIYDDTVHDLAVASPHAVAADAYFRLILLRIAVEIFRRNLACAGRELFPDCRQTLTGVTGIGTLILRVLPALAISVVGLHWGRGLSEIAADDHGFAAKVSAAEPNRGELRHESFSRLFRPGSGRLSASPSRAVRANARRNPRQHVSGWRGVTNALRRG